jgi:hypothetical protein
LSHQSNSLLSSSGRHAAIGRATNVIARGSSRIADNLRLQSSLLNQMIHNVFGGGRSANVAKANKQQLVGAICHKFIAINLVSQT